MKFTSVAIPVAAVLVVLAGCGNAPKVTGDASPTAQISADPTPSAVPTPTSALPRRSPSPSTSPCTPANLCVGRAATATEAAAMLAVGRPGAEKELSLRDWSVCSGSQKCFRVANPTGASIGTDAGSFNGGSTCKTHCSGAACTVYLYKDASGWHYVNARCYQDSGYVPGRQDRVYVTGCANFRSTPSLTAEVLGCLGTGTFVDVDSAPVYAEGHIWWHLAGRGWMAHDFLVAPKNCAC